MGITISPIDPLPLAIHCAGTLYMALKASRYLLDELSVKRSSIEAIDDGPRVPRVISFKDDTACGRVKCNASQAMRSRAPAC